MGPPPFDLEATTFSSSRIDLNWKNGTGYNSVEIYRDDGGGYEHYDDVWGSETHYEDIDCLPEHEYCYKLKGVVVPGAPGGTTDYSNSNCATTFKAVEDPTDVEAIPISDIEIDVIFKDNSIAETGHRLQREISTNLDVWLDIVELEPNREFFRDGGLFLLASGYTNCAPTDIGKQVHDNGGAIGPLIAYDNTRRRWLIDSNGHTIVDAESMTIDGGAGAGAGTAARETKGLVKGSSYTYRVRASAASPSADVESAQVTTISEPAIPTLAVILAADIKDKSIRLRWTDNSDNETGFRIEKSDNDSFEADEGELIAVVGADVTDFLVTGLTPGTPYWFRIRAYNAAGYSNYSDVRTDTTDAAYVPTEFEKWIRDPNIEPVYLAEIYTKMTLTTFEEHGDNAWKKTIGASDRGIDILEVFEGLEDADPELSTYTPYTKVDTPEETMGTGTESTFHFNYDTRTLYIHTSDSTSPNLAKFLIEGAFWLYFSTHKDKEFTVNGRLNHYPNYLSIEDIPDITQEIKPYFEGSFSISSGSIAFKNSGGFFDEKFATYTWINGKVILKAGRDDFTYAQFEEIFTARISEKGCTDEKITFQLRDIREDMGNKIVLNKFNIIDYPDVEKKFKDKPIPIYFGTQDLITPVCIEETDERFKCNDGRIQSVGIVYKNNVVLVEDVHYFVDLQRAIIVFNRDGKFIIDATNKEIDFREAAGELNATLTEKTYTTAELLIEIKNKLDAAGDLTYTVTCPSDTKKFKIAASGNFSLLWKSGTNGEDGTDTHVGGTIGYYDDEDDTGDDSYEADEDVISIHRQDILGVQMAGLVNSADELIHNGADAFKYLMNTYKGLTDSELNLDSIYEAKYASGAYDSTNDLDKALTIPIESEIPFDEIIRSIEHSIESYTFQDEFGRLGIRPQQTEVASNAKYIVSGHIFDHSQRKDGSSLFWKVLIYYNKNLQTDDWEMKTDIDNEIYWRFKVEEELEIYTYFRSSAYAGSLATSILNLLNKEQIENELPMLLFDVMPGDLIKFSRTRFYDSDGTADEITLRVLRISKSPASGRTSILAEVKV